MEGAGQGAISRFLRQRLTEIIDLDDAEMELLDGFAGTVRHLPRQSVIRPSGAPVEQVFLLVEGWAMSSVNLPDGQRQIVKVHLPGDFLGSPSIVLRKSMETLTTLTPAVVAPVSLELFGALFHRAPRLAAAFFLSVQQERVILTDRIVSMGRTPAVKRVGTLLLHIFERLRVLDPDQSPDFELPLTQEQLGDILGITPVHVNRTLKELQAEGLIERSGHHYRLDLPRLRAFCRAFDREWVRNPEWLRP